MDAKEAKKQLDKMRRFIHVEANQKANEIRLKTESEYSIERAKIVQSRKLEIQKEFERKEKQVTAEGKIESSNLLNHSRIELLKAREAAILKVKEEARIRLVELSHDKGKYEAFLRDSIVQGMFKLNEGEITVHCRQVDEDVVKSLLSTCQDLYNKHSNRTSTLTVSDIYLLPPPSSDSDAEYCSGGVVLSARDGRIRCDNTLDIRLDHTFEALLPQVRGTLFGYSKRYN